MTTSFSRTVPAMRRATARKTSSPTACPWVSLMALKSLRSTNARGKRLRAPHEVVELFDTRAAVERAREGVDAVSRALSQISPANHARKTDTERVKPHVREPVSRAQPHHAQHHERQRREQRQVPPDVVADVQERRAEKPEVDERSRGALPAETQREREKNEVRAPPRPN